MSYKRILLKLSGEALMGDKPFGHDLEALKRICKDIKAVQENGVQVCLECLEYLNFLQSMYSNFYPPHL